MSAAVQASGPAIPAAGTTLTAPIATAAQADVTVASAIGFPAPSFYINIGAEVLLVTAFGGADNTTWTVMRGQLGTTAATAVIGAAVTPAYAAQIVSWGGAPADEVSAESMAASALGILKSQQASEDAWLALAPTLMNPVRENQSAALQAYLIAQRDNTGNLIYSDTNGLFNYFLIDTQMTSCMLTSRVVQAYIAVQIFVERSLMNLEAPQVVVDLTKDDTWNQWEWMSRYRTWEANREVFLFPENWLIESQRPNRHRDLPDVRAGSAPGTEHCGLSRDRGSQLHRSPGRARPSACHRHMRRSGERNGRCRSAHARRPSCFLSAFLHPHESGGGGRVDRLDEDTARHQSPPGRVRTVPGPRLPFLGRRQSIQ
jgi:hypothetical protein